MQPFTSSCPCSIHVECRWTPIRKLSCPEIKITFCTYIYKVFDKHSVPLLPLPKEGRDKHTHTHPPHAKLNMYPSIPHLSETRYIPFPAALLAPPCRVTTPIPTAQQCAAGASLFRIYLKTKTKALAYSRRLALNLQGSTSQAPVIGPEHEH